MADYNDPRRQPFAGMVGQSAGPAFNPLANWLATQGVNQQPGFWQNLMSNFAAPAVDRVEGFARGVVGAAGEATGAPAAARAGEAFAAGDPMRGAGEALMGALPAVLPAVLPRSGLSAALQFALPRTVPRAQGLSFAYGDVENFLRDAGARNVRTRQANAGTMYTEFGSNSQPWAVRIPSDAHSQPPGRPSAGRMFDTGTSMQTARTHNAAGQSFSNWDNLTAELRQTIDSNRMARAKKHGPDPLEATRRGMRASIP